MAEAKTTANGGDHPLKTRKCTIRFGGLVAVNELDMNVRENITLGHEAVPDSAVLRAAEMAGVMNFLRDSEAGLDTQVGERGENLSGGQRQAIAIARALLYDRHQR